MTDTRELPTRTADEVIPAPKGLRVRPQRPVRAILALLLVVASVVAALTVYTRIGDRTDVLVATRTILAGEQVSETDFRVVSISTEDQLATVSAADRQVLVGQYARVRVEADAVLTISALQTQPLVSADRVLMSVLVPTGQVPVGLREQSRVVLVVTPDDQSEPELVEATIAAVPTNLTTLLADTANAQSSSIPLSVEVAPEFVSLVGSAIDVSLGVLDPSAPLPGDQFSSATPVEDSVGATTEEVGGTTDEVVDEVQDGTTSEAAEGDG